MRNQEFGWTHSTHCVRVAPLSAFLLFFLLLFCEVGEAAFFDITAGWEMTAECF